MAGLPPEQQAIRDKCFHPTGSFVEFKKADIEQSIPQRFENMVRQHGHRLAIKDRHHALTYDELNNAANRVANTVLSQRGDEEPVATLFGLGVTGITAILGVLKAGKTYVPLDPSYPGARTSRTLENSQAALILTDDQNLDFARELANERCELLNIDELDSGISSENPNIHISPDRLAFIIYTSGSTGLPKGVSENHRNVLHQALRLNNILHIAAEDRQTLLRSTSFVGSVKDIFGTLLNGAGLFLFDIKNEGLNSLAAWLRQEEITMYRSVVTVFRHLASALPAGEQFPRLRLVYVGGEALYPSDLDLYQAHFSPDCIFLNGLGLTESGSVRYYFMDKETRVSTTNIPVGYPVEDMEIVLLDEEGQEIGFNRVGEIAIRSRYLCQGYWREPELTRAAFFTEAGEGGQRTYRTGDLGRMLDDGCLTHLGRKDFQVKVRGHRVDVSEVEMVLLEHEGINEAIVVQGGEGSGTANLVAYLTAAGDLTPNVSELRNFIGENLPEHMVPSRFVVLGSFPLLPNGKVDRLSLPATTGTRPVLQNAFLAARTPVEEKLGEIWSLILGFDQVGIHDNFLELGGDSLLASQVISQVIKTFQVEVPLRSLFESPTVADMALVIIQNLANAVGQEKINRILKELEALSNENAQ